MSALRDVSELDTASFESLVDAVAVPEGFESGLTGVHLCPRTQRVGGALQSILDLQSTISTPDFRMNSTLLTHLMG